MFNPTYHGLPGGGQNPVIRDHDRTCHLPLFSRCRRRRGSSSILNEPLGYPHHAQDVIVGEMGLRSSLISFGLGISERPWRSHVSDTHIHTMTIRCRTCLRQSSVELYPLRQPLLFIAWSRLSKPRWTNHRNFRSNPVTI